jgi:hypothetical protein
MGRPGGAGRGLGGLSGGGMRRWYGVLQALRGEWTQIAGMRCLGRSNSRTQQQKKSGRRKKKKTERERGGKRQCV